MTKSKDLVFILFIAAVLVGCIALGSGYIGNLVVWMSVAAVMATSLRFVLLDRRTEFRHGGLLRHRRVLHRLYRQLPGPAVLPDPGPERAARAGGERGVGCITLKVKGPYFLLIGFAFTEALRIPTPAPTCWAGTRAWWAFSRRSGSKRTTTISRRYCASR